MKMQILHSSILLYIGILLPLFLVFIFSSSVAADDSSSPSLYDTCSPRNCKKGPNITFPFYLDDHNQSCGYPGFDITCQGDYPVYCSSEASYIVHNISDDGSSIQLINNSTKNSTCPVPLVNFSFERSGMNFTPDVGDLCFFYGCNISLFAFNATRVSCKKNSFVSVAEIGNCDALFEQTERVCHSYVGSPFRVNRSHLEDLKRSEGEIDYEELLRDGFTLLTGHDCSRCHNSGGRCGYDSTIRTTVCHCRDGTRLIDCGGGGNGKKQMQIGLGVGIGGLAVIIILVFSIYMMIRRHRRRRSKSTHSKNNNSAEDSFGGSNIYFEVPIFSNDELEKATNNFDSSKELGDGGYGTVYYGKLRDGREVAVKRLYEHNYRRVKQFMTEVQILTRLRHTNLVSLYGCTSRHSRELLLVYEYVPNGTVADHLHGDRAKPGLVPWPVRMNIAIETAKALAYLHKEGIIHRDVKTNNILLDKNFSVKVGDFGLSRLWPTDVTHVSTAPQGTPGYVDPEYHLCYQLTEKSDVYSFGVVLVELVSSMPAVDISRDRHEINLANLAVKKIQKCEVDELIDPKLNCESDEEIKNMVTATIEVAFRCLQQDREIRPTMEEVVEELENAIQSGRRVEEESCNAITSSESDEAGLLNNVKFLTSPISVMVQNLTNSSSSMKSKTSSSTL